MSFRIAAAAAYLRGKGLRLEGDPARRFWIDPAQAVGRRIYFSETELLEKPAAPSKRHWS